jgi:hypothetical protein
MHLAARLKKAKQDHIPDPRTEDAKQRLMRFSRTGRTSFFVNDGPHIFKRYFSDLNQLMIFCSEISTLTNTYAMPVRRQDDSAGYIVGDIVDRFTVGGVTFLSVVDYQSDSGNMTGRSTLTIMRDRSLKVKEVALFVENLRGIDFFPPKFRNLLGRLSSEDLMNLIAFDVAITTYVRSQYHTLGYGQFDPMGLSLVSEYYSPYIEFVLAKASSALSGDGTTTQLPTLDVDKLTKVRAQIRGLVDEKLISEGIPPFPSIVPFEHIDALEENIFGRVMGACPLPRLQEQLQ